MMRDCVDEVYEQFGRFCVEFEQVCRYMENCIRHILLGEGLTNGSIHEILLTGYTAEPLRQLLQNLIGEVLVANDRERTLCNKVFLQIQALIQKRNNLIHSKWWVMKHIAEDGDVNALVHGNKFKANKDGLATKEQYLSFSELKEAVTECINASIMLALLLRCIIGTRCLFDCFALENGGLIPNMEALQPDIISNEEPR